MSIFRDLLSMPNRRTESILFPVQYKTNSSGVLERVLITKSVRLPTVTDLDDWCFRGVFQNMTDIEYFSLDDLSIIDGVAGAFSDAFKGTTSLTGVVFPKGLSITGDSNNCFSNAFYNADLTNLTSFPFENLKTTNGMSVMDSVFMNSRFPSSWTSITFNELESIGNPSVDSRNSFHNAFSGTTIKTYNFPKLEYIKSSSCFEGAFPTNSVINCPVLKTMIGGVVFRNTSKTSTLNLDTLETMDSIPFGPFPHQIVNYSIVNAPALSTIRGKAFLNIGEIELDSVVRQDYYSETYKNIDSLRFRNLTVIQGTEKTSDTVTGLFSGTFGDIYFNKLSEIPETYLFTCSYSGTTLNPASTATLHFSQENKSSIMSSPGWDVRWGLGTEGVVEFDLFPDSDELYRFTVKLVGGNKGTIAEYLVPYGLTLREYITENSISLNGLQNQTGLNFVSWDRSLDEPIKEDCTYTASYTVTVTFGTNDPDIYIWKNNNWLILKDNPRTEVIPWNTKTTIIPPPQNITKEGYEFDGYSVDIDNPITISQTISPIYRIMQVSVRFVYKNERINKTFVLYDSVEQKEITVDYGSSLNDRLESASNIVWKDISSDLTYPFNGLDTEIHHELGYQFNVWSKSRLRKEIFDFDSPLTPIDSYYTLYAYFIEIRVNLTFDVNPDLEDETDISRWKTISVLEGTMFKDVPTPRELVVANIPAGSGFDSAAESWYYFDSETEEYVLLRKLSSTYLVMTDMVFYPKYIGTNVTLNFVDIHKDYQTTQDNNIDFVRIWNTGDRIKYPYEIYDTQDFVPESEKEYFGTGYVKKLDTATQNIYPEDIENNNPKGVYQPSVDGSVFLGWTRDNTYNFTEKWGNIFWYHQLKPSQKDFKVWFEGLTDYIGIRRTNLKSAIEKRYLEILYESIVSLTGKDLTSTAKDYTNKLKNADPELFSDVITQKVSGNGTEYPSLTGNQETLVNRFSKKTEYQNLLTSIIGTESTYEQTEDITYHAFQSQDFGFIIGVSLSNVSDNGTVMDGVPLQFTQTAGNVNYCNNGLLYDGYFGDVPFGTIRIEDEYDEYSAVLESNSILYDVIDFNTKREQIRQTIETYFIDNTVDYSQNKESLYDRIAGIIGGSERFTELLSNIREAIEYDTILNEYVEYCDNVTDIYKTRSKLELDNDVVDSVVELICEYDTTVEDLFEECVKYIRNNRVYPVTTQSENYYVNDTIRYTTTDSTYSDIVSNIEMDDVLKGYIRQYLGYTTPVGPDGESTEKDTYNPFVDPRNIKQSDTIYGYWMSTEVRNKTYTFSYVVNGSSFTKTVNMFDTVEWNESEIPDSGMYDIVSWEYYRNNTLYGDFVFGETEITGDTTLVANVVPKKFNVIFDYNYGEDTTYTISYGNRLVPEYTIGQTEDLLEIEYTTTETDEDTGDVHNVTAYTYTDKEYDFGETVDRGVFVGYTMSDVDLTEHILNTYSDNVKNGRFIFLYGEQPTREDLVSMFMSTGISQYIYNFNNKYNPSDGLVLHGYWLPIQVWIRVTLIDIESGYEIVEIFEAGANITDYTPEGYIKTGNWIDSNGNVVDVITKTTNTIYGRLTYNIDIEDIVEDEEQTVIHNVKMSDVINGSGWDGVTAVRFNIPEGYSIGSTSTSEPALTIDGEYPLGLSIVNYGLIAGAGGKGGSFVNGYGEPGGTAINVIVECSLENNGVIAGGGGGGGAGAIIKYNTNIYDSNMTYLNTYFYNAYGSGGGGGAGVVSGTGGSSIGTTTFWPDNTGGEINLVLSGSSGIQGSLTKGGEGGAEGSYIFEDGIPRTVFTTAGGKGGDLGESGDSGGNGYTGFEDIDTTEYREIIIGYAGGAAGSPIEGTDKVSLSGNGVIK